MVKNMTMIVVNIFEAKAKLSEYLDMAAQRRTGADLQAQPARGRTARGPVGAHGAAAHRSGTRAVAVPPSFFDPLPEDVLARL